jgi:adenylylsulfate kinase
MKKSSNTVYHQATVTRARRNNANNHQSVVLWFTGLSGSGKSTLAHSVEEALFQRKCQTIVLDGDNVRHGLNSDLEFSDGDRIENIRRIGEVSKLFLDAGLIVLAAFISPYRNDRMIARNLVGKREFIEVYVDSPLEVCEKRDPKGLYEKARAGQIRNFTGISSRYEAPENPEVHVNGYNQNVEESSQVVIRFLEQNGYL